MKILFQARTNLFTAPGGDTTQIINTKKYLELLGIGVDLSIKISDHINYEEYDLVHLFNYTRISETFFYAKKAKLHNKKVILSTIYWDNTDFETNGSSGIRAFIANHLSIDAVERLKAFAKLLKGQDWNISTLNFLIIGQGNLQKRAINFIDYYLPNAEVEMTQFNKNFAPDKNLKYSVVPNSVDIKFHQKELADNKFLEFEGCILCVGRIDTRKNQLNLIKALKNTNFKIVFVGQAAPNHKQYMNQVLREAGENCHFLGWLAYDDIIKLYKIAKVHACPSWYETPGLASLEAAYFGCNVVITRLGSTEEYFGGDAFYCEPDNLESIKLAVQNAYNAPKNQRMHDRVLESYTWENTAKVTLDAYKKILNVKSI